MFRTARICEEEEDSYIPHVPEDAVKTLIQEEQTEQKEVHPNSSKQMHHPKYQIERAHVQLVSHLVLMPVLLLVMLLVLVEVAANSER